MHWLQSLDVGSFRFVNSTLQNSFFDVVMPFFSGNAIFYPFLALAGVLGFWFGDRRLRTWLLLLLIIVPLGDSFVCNNLKHAAARLRPFAALSDVHQLVAASPNSSMPSSHAANWAAGLVITLFFYRRGWLWVLPLCLIVSFSRIYNGVHFPSDVLAGWLLGAAYGYGAVRGLEALWSWAGPNWFPLWWRKIPVLVPDRPPKSSHIVKEVSPDAHWLHLAYVFIFGLLVFRWGYIASGTIELSEDEAYQWLWSKHLALGYYSKPPLIAYAQWLGTHLWGDTFFGVRFLAPVLGTVQALVLLRFLAREFSARLSFIFLLIITATPVLAVGGVLMTVDALSVCFWTLAMVAGWRAIRADSTTADWCLVGLWMGLGALSKYTAFMQWACWACVFAFIPVARKQLRRPGIYLALLINIVCLAPVIFWNWQHDWISVHHTAERGNLTEPWHPTLRYVTDFLGAEAFLLNPIFFIASLWALIAWWRIRKTDSRLTYFVCMGAPVFLFYFLWTFHSRVLPNWIAPAILPMLVVAVIYWNQRRQQGAGFVQPWLKVGLGLGLVVVVLLHDTDLLFKATRVAIPAGVDETLRLQGWKKTAALVADEREKLLAEGRPVFVVGGHYGISSQMAFNLSAARPLVSSDKPLVYCRHTEKPTDQFYLWPGYLDRKGENAIFIQHVGEKEKAGTPPPPEMLAEFESVTNLGVFEVQMSNRIARRVQLFACRGLR